MGFFDRVGRLASRTINTISNEKSPTAILASMLVGFLAIVLYATQATSWAQFASIIGVALIIALASSLSGGLLGFLFGIPRTLQRDTVEEIQSIERSENRSDDNRSRTSYQANTNLEQISDWLTKILVGVGLTQIAQLPGAMLSYAEFTSAGLGSFPSSEIFSVALLVYFLICGFLISYLITRLNLVGALTQADTAAIAALESKVSDIEKQAEIDARALSAVQRQLNPGTDTPPLTQQQMNQVIQPASQKARAQIFYMAQEVRSQNWRNRQDKPKMERTISIFRALIASDTEDIYHLNHGQLGFALKDKRNPNYEEAESELSKAIELRESWRDHGWLLYEFVRGYCRIKQEPHEQGMKSDENKKLDILDDLRTASNASGLVDLIRNDPDISKWMEVNDLTMADVRS